MSAETKSWMTPARLARGPEAANDELRRWAKERHRRKLVTEMRGTFRPAQIYGDAAAMRHDALTSRQNAVGSRLMARDAGADGLGLVDVAVGLAAVGAGFLIGRWLVRRKVVAAPTAVKVIGDDYVTGALVLGSF